MQIKITSKNNEQIFHDTNVINIGTTQNCDYKLNLNFDLIVSLQKNDNGNWQIVNSLKSDKVLFKGQPIVSSIEITSVCKLMVAGTDEFIAIKFMDADSALKTVSASLSSIKKQDNSRTISVIENEDLNEQDIEALYGKGIGAQAKIKIERKKIDIEKRRVSIIKEISYKANFLRNKLSQNELVLAFLNFFIIFIPLAMAFVLKDIIRLESLNGQLQNRVLFLAAIAFIIVSLILKLGQFLSLQNKAKIKNIASSKTIQTLCLVLGFGIFGSIIVFSLWELLSHFYNLPVLIPQMLIGTSCLSIFLAIFAAITQNTIAETGEELDAYESREDFQTMVKDYQQWISLYVNNITRKRIKDISNKIFNLELKAGIEYFIGIITAPFLAYGVSQTLAECFPEAAGWIRLSEGFKFSPVFLTLATLMIVFAFHCFATSFATSKRVLASDIIKRDGFSNYNIHGAVLHGVEAGKNLKKEAKKFFLIALCVIFIEITMNVSYFIGVLGSDMQGMILSFISALVPTAILIMETTMLGNTKFEIIIKEELIDKIDKDY